MSRTRQSRLFLDSNVFIRALIVPWGLDRSVLCLCAARRCRLLLATRVHEEVEENLSITLLEDFIHLIQQARPEIVPPPAEAHCVAARHLIRHGADVPVLLSAMASGPDWFLTNNTRHFSPAVARRTGLRIATPADFFRTLL